ncbi:hypothetical protein EDB83DRAFT_1792506 [Lactarius deliciosus]|nr:hypothetical protein EDB83DRAFT_1792506 [Lactarius deliciosus]
MGVGLLTYLVSSFDIWGEASAAVSSYRAWNCAYGLLTECLRSIAAKYDPPSHAHKTRHETPNSPIFARCPTPPPYFLKQATRASPASAARASRRERRAPRRRRAGAWGWGSRGTRS